MRHFIPLILILEGVGCSGSARVLNPPSQPPSWFAARLGVPCSDDMTWSGGLEHCSAGKVSYVIRTHVHYLITGKAPGEGCCTWGVPCRRYGEDPVDQTPRMQFPPRHLGTRTLVGSRGYADEQRFYTDGALLWVVGIFEKGINCHEGTILIADRRLLTQADRVYVRNLISVDDSVDLDKDEELERAIKPAPPRQSR